MCWGSEGADVKVSDIVKAKMLVSFRAASSIS